VRILLRVLLALAILGLAAWAALALHFGPPASTPGAAVVAATGLLAVICVLRPHASRWPIAVFAAVVLGFLLVWSGVEPSNDRDWQADVAELPYASFEDDRVTIHNIRNFDYRSETDYTPRYYDKTFDLRELD
jgi:hypothetical protein